MIDRQSLVLYVVAAVALASGTSQLITPETAKAGSCCLSDGNCDPLWEWCDIYGVGGCSGGAPQTYECMPF